MTSTPWFINNDNIHKDLRIPKVQKEFDTVKQRYIQKLRTHINILPQPLANLISVYRLSRADMPTEG